MEGFPSISSSLGPSTSGDPSTLGKLVVNDALSVPQRLELQKTLLPFTSIFSDVPGLTDLVEHRIETPEGRHIRIRPYRIPAARKTDIKREVTEMLKLGVIRPSQSCWSSPIVMIPKPDGSTRFCMDFRALNDISTFDAYPIPRVDDLIERLGEAEYITTLDLTKGYWQVPLRESDKQKTAFATEDGLYEFNVLPFGLHGAPATFQRLMNVILAPFPTFSAAYLDDIVIFSKTWNEHLTHLATVLQALRKAGLHINAKKSRAAFNSVHYLGYVLGKGLIAPQDEKVKAVQDTPFPSTKRELHAFLGLIEYYRRFIPNFAELASPLTNALKNAASSRELKHPSLALTSSFVKLKQTLTNSPVLISPSFTKPFSLSTDASDHGLGAVLSQVGPDGLEHPIKFLSRKLTPREQKYPIIERECLAIRWAVERQALYLVY